MNAFASAPSYPLAALHPSVVVLLAILGIGAAVALHFLPVSKYLETLLAAIVGPVWAAQLAWWGHLTAKVLVTSLAWWLTMAAISRWLLFMTSSPLWTWCLLGGLGTEALLALYLFECRSVSRTVGNSLLALRITLLVIVFVWLTQPAWHKEWSTPIDRYVAVLVDGSASMGLVDKELTARERLDLARLFAVDLPDRPPQLEENRRQIADLEPKFAVQLRAIELLGAAGTSQIARQLQSRAARFSELSAETVKASEALDKSLAEIVGRKLQLDPPTAAAITGLQGQIKALRDGPLTRLSQVPTKVDDAATQRVTLLRDDVRNVIETLGRFHQEIETLPLRLDEAYWRSLPAAQRAEIEKKTNLARSAIAHQVLVLKGKDNKPLVEELHDGYQLKFYEFASQPVQLPAATFLPKEKAKLSEETLTKAESQPTKPQESTKTAAAADESSPDEARRTATDVSAALRQVLEDIPVDRLSGVIVLWDGRHNADDPLQPVANQLKSQHIPVSTVVIGTRQVPKDAALAGLDVPDTILSGDKLALKARLKVDGYRGQEIVAKLFRGTEEVDHKNIKVPEDHHEPRVEFSHLPKEPGLFTYRVELVSTTGAPLLESVMVNNSYSRQVSVTDDRIKLLLIDARPRWEFRYLKNLFAGRDKTVHLQYLLTNPDRIEGVAKAPPARVSASRPYGQFEGTDLPENEQEWLKFDVIVLGDVSPTTFDKPTLKLLDKFVGLRGGSLIVVAGANYMPHAYAETPLAEMLPVRFEKVAGWLGQGPEPGFHWMLSAEGRESVLMKLADSPAESIEQWKSFPIFRWRHPKTRAKEGATVLAYAESAYATQRPSGVTTPEDEQRKERDNALVCVGRYGAGKVLMLTCDRTWQERYRVGDKYHHRFWGQILRWATEDKLAAGTQFVRLGTDRRRYSVGQPVTIKARLLDEKGDPIKAEDLKPEDVEAKVYRGQKLVRTVALAPEPGVPGRFRADLGTISEPGTLRIELTGPTVDRLLALGETRKVQTEVPVNLTKMTSELVELTADDAVPRQLADLTQGQPIQGRVVAPAEAATLLTALGPKSGSIDEFKNFNLWDYWAVLLVFLVAGSVEWILRKKAGLT